MLIIILMLVHADYYTDLVHADYYTDLVHADYNADASTERIRELFFSLVCTA